MLDKVKIYRLFYFHCLLMILKIYYSARNQIEGFVTCPSQQIQDDMFVMITLCILLNADDTVLMSESAYDLQKSLDVFAEYCNLWTLQVNIAKTKVLIFSKGPMTKRKFLYKDIIIEKVKDFCYLGKWKVNTAKTCKPRKLFMVFYAKYKILF